MKQQFDGTTERASAPRDFTGEYVYNQVKDIEVTFGKKKKAVQNRKNNEKNEENKMLAFERIWRILDAWIEPSRTAQITQETASMDFFF